MARRLNPGKQRVWMARLSRFHSSKLTMANFCRIEKISLSSLQYWLRKSAKDPASSRLMARTTNENESAAWARFVVNSRLEISVPAHCLDAIRCIVAAAYDSGDIPSSFRRIQLGSQGR